MEFIVKQDPFTLHPDDVSCISDDLGGIDFNEIKAVAVAGITYDESVSTVAFDNTKLMEDPGIGLPFDNTKVMIDTDAFIGQPAAPAAKEVQSSTFTSVQYPPVQGNDFSPLSPEMILLQPASPDVAIIDQPELMDLSKETLMSFIAAQLGESLPVQAASPVQAAAPVQTVSSVQALEPVQVSDPVQVALPVQAPYTVLAMDAAVSPSPVQVKAEVDVMAGQSSLCVLDNVTRPSKRRGRKPKNPDGRAPRRVSQKKVKVYELGPLNDPMAEKKRRNACTAKLHRDKQKKEKETLAIQLEEVTQERDRLLKELEHYKFNELQLKQRLMNMQHSGSGLQR